MNSEGSSHIRRKSMYGTALFALGIAAAIAAVVTGSVWLVGAAVAFLVLGLVLLQQVGKSLS
jgi:general stress protein CsbA